jgi:tRNA A37 methylthiotransferase MiaB
MCAGQEFYALIEERIDNNFFTGTTENYIQVFFQAKENYKPGDLIKVKLLGSVDGVGSKNFLVPGEALLH